MCSHVLVAVISCFLFPAVTRGGSMKPEYELQSEEDEDDEAPEEVTFQTAKSQAEESARTKRHAARREKELLKEKRKLKEELFKEQKKRKLLSEDILQTVTTRPEGEEKQTEDTLQEKGDERKANSGRKRSLKKELRPKARLQDNYNVVRLEDYKLLGLQQEKAKSFLQNKLYGRLKNRTTANEFLSIASKKGAVKKPAVQFTDSAWGKEEKTKAEKFNLKWAHREKL
ncbi:U3 small nucleolar RNA-associated protein NOL7 [Discoglossus pictus]